MCTVVGGRLSEKRPVINDYQRNEVVIDYNVGLVGMAAFAIAAATK